MEQQLIAITHSRAHRVHVCNDHVCNATDHDYVDMIVGIQVKRHTVRKCYFCLSELLLGVVAPRSEVLLVYAYYV